METSGRRVPERGPRLFGFTRKHVMPRLGDTLFHRNVAISIFSAGALVFASFYVEWFPALQKAAVKDFVAGLLAFSALGFGAATAATVLALSMPRSRLYSTMILNGNEAPRVRVVVRDGEDVAIMPDGNLPTAEQYGPKFRSYYSDLMFVFLWTMAAQLFMGISGIVYFGLAGDLNMVDYDHWRRSSAGLFVAVAFTTYAVMQLGSLLKALADYAIQQERYDRASLLNHGDVSSTPSSE